ncbi:glycoside hydrolase family 25 protein [Speluncibacter jeojiensis]|uniref:Glycoside hydrolase family 25 protein n=1 Tax=Speluncibacter jeojiensis TaxID=2710754 RepID=A0A9X4LYN8_9ACTN|nr:glycoside hydrolase family 25 protein [Rhodococcus sp. D2-41]MDG3013679.1 glycoside hydrolase family 25 protein [Corynebacteriales bacterium D3-21]
MTLYGIDISSYQAGLNLAEVKAEGFDFVFVKVSEGSGYVNPTWPGFRDAARAAGLILAGYHYVTGDDPAAQANNLVSHLGDTSIPVMLDFEANSGDIANFWAVLNAITAAGGHVALSYIPHWYWQQIGSPDLSAVPGLVASDYVSGTGYASDLYPGDQSGNWFAYGGATPVVLQFTDAAQVAGQTVDADAFRGTAAQLQQLLTPSGDDVTPAQAQQLQDIWVQLLGPNGRGWPQLGNRTLVDALAVVLTQLTGQDPAAFAGWPQTGGRTDTDLIAAIAAALKVPGTFDTKA